MGKNTFKIEFAGISRSKTVYIKKPAIEDGFWSDPKTGSGLKEATYGEKVRFTVGTKDIDDGTVLNFILYDYDGNYNADDELSRFFSTKVKNNIAKLEFIPDIKWEGSAKYETDKVVETYFKIEAEIKGKKVSAQLPIKESDYLKIYPKEVKITVLVELPHSLETGWGAKGLAGHTAMAIGDKYFDYGPDNSVLSVNEKKYDYDFNNDGDKKDTLKAVIEKDLNKDLNNDGDKYDRFINGEEINFKFAPGRPWWGEMIASIKGGDAKNVTLSDVISFIKPHWHKNNVYGEVHKIEFYVNKQQGQKMLNWWNNRYDHLKVYSAFPWTGEQCTTTVKSALQAGGINIPDETQKPSGILQDFKTLTLRTSFKHKYEIPKITIIKKESTDWPTP